MRQVALILVLGASLVVRDRRLALSERGSALRRVDAPVYRIGWGCSSSTSKSLSVPAKSTTSTMSTTAELTEM